MEHNGFEYVDLGLSVYWATMNVGASDPYDGGLFFRWGDTVGYTENDARNNLVDFSLSLFKKEDGVHRLPLERDAAHLYMGGDWRMPTKEELSEFVNSTKHRGKIDKLPSHKYQCIFSIDFDGKNILFPSNGYITPYNMVKDYVYGAFIWSKDCETRTCGHYITAHSFSLMGGNNMCTKIHKETYQTIYGHSIRGVLPKS